MGHVVSTKGIPSIDQQSLVRGLSDAEECGPGDGTTGEECPICTEIVAIKHLARLNPCNHEFHQECINQWLDDHSTCPNCRGEVCQVLFNFRGNTREVQNVTDNEEEEEEEDNDDIDILEGDDEDFDEEEEDIDLDDFESLPTEIQYLGEEVSIHELPLGEEEDDSLSILSSQVKIKTSGDDFIIISFYARTPEVYMHSTDAHQTWQVIHDDQIVMFVQCNTQLIVRGYYFLHLEELVIQVGGNKYPLRDDPDFEEFLHPSQENLAFFDLPETEVARADRIHLFMEFLRNHFNE